MFITSLFTLTVAASLDIERVIRNSLSEQSSVIIILPYPKNIEKGKNTRSNTSQVFGNDHLESSESSSISDVWTTKEGFSNEKEATKADINKYDDEDNVFDEQRKMRLSKEDLNPKKVATKADINKYDDEDNVFDEQRKICLFEDDFNPKKVATKADINKYDDEDNVFDEQRKIRLFEDDFDPKKEATKADINKYDDEDNFDNEQRKIRLFGGDSEDANIFYANLVREESSSTANSGH